MHRWQNWITTELRLPASACSHPSVGRTGCSDMAHSAYSFPPGRLLPSLHLALLIWALTESWRGVSKYAVDSEFKSASEWNLPTQCVDMNAEGLQLKVRKTREVDQLQCVREEQCKTGVIVIATALKPTTIQGHPTSSLPVMEFSTLESLSFENHDFFFC